MSGFAPPRSLPIIEAMGRPQTAADVATIARMTEKPGIYAIRHLDSARVYVGSASNLSKRWSRHRRDLRSGLHRNAHLQSAWDKYGEYAFEFVVLELTDHLDVREQHWIDALDSFDNGFNLCPTARSSRGRKWSEDERASRAKTIKNRKPESAESRESRSARARAMAVSQRKLSPWQVDEVRARYGERRGHRRPHARNGGGITMQQLATEYGVSLSTMSQIINGKAYA